MKVFISHHFYLQDNLVPRFFAFLTHMAKDKGFLPLQLQTWLLPLRNWFPQDSKISPTKTCKTWLKLILAKKTILKFVENVNNGPNIWYSNPLNDPSTTKCWFSFCLDTILVYLQGLFYWPISCHWFLSIPHGNIRKHLVFWCFSGGIERDQ